MKKGDYIFVYGTLRRGERADINKNALIHSVSFISIDHINGKMYHIGAFPGVKLVASATEEYNPALPSVTGEIYYIGDYSVVSILDCYEGYNHEHPESGHYNRHQVLTKEGRLVWVYTYNPYASDDQLIETGDWRNPRLKQTHRIPNTRGNT